MSLLPTTLQPPGDPIGRVNEVGEVIPDKNFWLLLYNLCQNVLGIGGGASAGLPASALTELSSLDADAADADAMALRSPVANLQKQQDYETTVLGADIALISRKADNALLLAQDLLLSDISATPGLSNPTGVVGLTAVNGVATTAIRSDGAPALSQAIAPTWTSQHIFTPGTSTTAIIVNTTVNNVGVSVRSGGGSGAIIETCGDGSGTGNGLSMTQTSVGAGVINLNFNASLSFKVNGTTRLTINASGTATFASAIGVNGNAPPAQVTGWGTPVGNAVINNYNITDAGGANSNTNKALAQIITDLKAFGLYGA